MPQGRGSDGGGETLGRERDAACTAASLVLTWEKQVADEEGRDEEVDSEQTLGMEESFRGMRKEDSS